MAENELNVQQISSVSQESYNVEPEKKQKPKKVNLEIGAAMLANDSGFGVGIEAGAEKKFHLKKGGSTYIDFKADGGLYTNGAKRASVYTGLKVEHNSNDKYRPIVPDIGLETRYIENTSEHTLSTHFPGHESVQKTDYKSQNLQVNPKLGLEYQTKNGKFTLGAGIKAGENMPLDNGFKMSDSYTDKKDIEIITPQGSQIATETTEYSAVYSKKPMVDVNLSGYANANYKVSKNLSVGLSGEYGNVNKEVKISAKYNF